MLPTQTGSTAWLVVAWVSLAVAFACGCDRDPPVGGYFDAMRNVEARRLRDGLGQGVRASLQNNLSAYGFSVMITATFGVLSATVGSPHVVDVFAFVAGAVTGVSIVDGIATHGFKYKFRSEDSDVVALGAALGYVSVGLAVGAAAGIGAIVGGWPGWALGALAATCAFVLLSGIEMTLARIAQEDRESATEQEPDSS